MSTSIHEKMMETIGTFEPTAAAAAKKSMSRAESRIVLALQQGSSNILVVYLPFHSLSLK